MRSVFVADAITNQLCTVLAIVVNRHAVVAHIVELMHAVGIEGINNCIPSAQPSTLHIARLVMRLVRRGVWRYRRSAQRVVAHDTHDGSASATYHFRSSDPRTP
jgi:hypothetical protein